VKDEAMEWYLQLDEVACISFSTFSLRMQLILCMCMLRPVMFCGRCHRIHRQEYRMGGARHVHPIFGPHDTVGLKIAFDFEEARSLGVTSSSQVVLAVRHCCVYSSP
jgi:hypothetical protein